LVVSASGRTHRAYDPLFLGHEIAAEDGGDSVAQPLGGRRIG
jgi:hypothetical protein